VVVFVVDGDIRSSKADDDEASSGLDAMKLYVVVERWRYVPWLV
jgi:hypothetical protein